MKKFIALLLALFLMLSLAACGGEKTKTEDEEEKKEQSEEEKDSDKQEGKEEIKDEEEVKTEAKEDKEEEDKIEDAEKPSFEEITVVDDENCLIKITGIDPDDLWGYAVKVMCENKSADKTYMFTVENASVNGVMFDPYYAEEIAAGKKANGSIDFSNEEIEKHIGDFTDIELTFRVYDSDDIMADDIVLKTVHVYPFGKEKATTFVREAKATDTVILDNEYARMTVTGYEEDELWGYTAKVFIENKTDKHLNFSIDDVSVNGFMCEPYYSEAVVANKCCFSEIVWSTSDFEDNGITTVDEIEFELTVSDYDDWFADNFVEMTVVLNP